MKSILITGRYSAFIQLLIERFDKEGWRISTLSQDRNAPPNVFQHYTTDYEAENLRHVLESSKPNVVVFAGAYDNDFFGPRIHREQRQRYISYVSALLLEAGRHSVQKFIYLSSDEVFDDSFAADITEDMQPNAASTAGMLQYMGEVLAREFSGSSAMDVVVLRLAGLYSVPLSAEDCGGQITAKCLQAVMMQPVQISSRHTYNVLHGSDAVEAVMCVLRADSHAETLYHVASPARLRDADVVDAIRDNASHAIELQDTTMGLESQRVLNGERFCREFGFRAREEMPPAVAAIMQSIRGSLRAFVPGGEQKKSLVQKLLQNLVAIAEVVLAVIVCFFLTRAMAGNPGLASINLYLLCSLLFATFYGTKIGILAASLSTICYFIGATGSPGLAMLVDVGVYVWIAQLFIVTLAVGYVRDTLTQTRADSDEEVRFLQSRLDDISSINSSNVRIKDFFETRVVDSSESIGYIYNIISILDTANRNSVIFEATKIITSIMGTRDVAIYRLFDNGFLRVVTSTSERARQLGKSVHRGDLPALFNQIDSKRLYINRGLTPGLPSLAGSLNDAEGNVNFVVMLWDVDYEHMTLYNTNMLRVICELISNAVIRATDYLDAVQSTRVVEGTAVMTEAAFEELHGVFAKAHEEGLADFCLLEVDRHGRGLPEMSKMLSGSLRFTDMVGVHGRDRLHILLNNTSLQDAMVVIRRLNGLGLDVKVLG